MGNISEFEQKNQYNNYSISQQQNKIWAGRYIVLDDPIHVRNILKKTIYLKSHKEAKQMVEDFKLQEKPQFYVISPLHVQLIKQEGLCAISQTVNVFHKPFLFTLNDKMNKKNKLLKENQIWFIISQVSHSLEILHKRNHPHLWICPETIYFNKDQNWFLQDIHYWRGPSFQNLLNQKYTTKQIMSDYMKKTISRHQFVDFSNACDEDIYCLGYAILIMMCGIHTTHLQKNSMFLLENSVQNYSKKLINLVKSMIQQIPQRRLTLEKLRFKLKIEQEDIMKEEMAQFKRQQKNRIHQRMTTSKNQNNKTSSRNLSPYLSADRKQIRADSFQTTAINSYNISPLGSHQRRNHIYFSPPSHRPAQFKSPPNYNKFQRVPNEFGYNSPRKF